MTQPRDAFARLRLDGERFRHRRLPVSALVELQRYEKLVEDVAATAWLIENPGRQLPARFRKRFDLTISTIEDGSAMPVLEREESLIDDELEVYYRIGNDTVEEAFSALTTGRTLPASFDWSASQEFKEFGSSLLDDEAIEFRPLSSRPIVFSASIRDEVAGRIRGLTSDEFTDTHRNPTPGAIAGRMYRLNARSRTFGLNPVGETYSVQGRYGSESLTPDFRAVVDSDAHAQIVRISGVIVRNALGQPISIIDASAVELFELEAVPTSARLVELADLAEGWDGQGAPAVAFSALDASRDFLSRDDVRRLPRPSIFPSRESGVTMEWAASGVMISLDIDEDGLLSIMAVDLHSREVDDLELAASAEHMAMVASFIQSKLGGASV